MPTSKHALPLRAADDEYPGLAGRNPLLAAATLLRDAGTRRDDACVLVARGAA